MERFVVSTVALLALAGSAMAQSPYGSIEFRWRERGLGVGTSTVLPSGAAATSTPANANSIAGATVTTDGRFHLVLEARVTRAAGNTDLGGLAGFAFNLVSSDTRSQGQFAGTTIGGQQRNAALASVANSGLTLPSGATTLPGTDGNGDRGVFGPFRRVADLGGKNQPAIGVQNLSAAGSLGNNPTLENITIGASVDPLSFVDTDPDTGEPVPGPYNGRFDYYGLDTWVPVFYAVYNLTDVTGRNEVVISAQIAGVAGADTGLRGFRGITNAQGVDSWLLDNAGLPSYTIVIPAPGAAALAGLGGLLIARRRR